MKFSAPIYQLKRQAKTIAREQKIALNQALDMVAQREGFVRWSMLAAQVDFDQPVLHISCKLAPGDLVLLGGRPGQGKTLLGLKLALAHIRNESSAYFFTLEYLEQEVLSRLSGIGYDAEDTKRLHIDTSNDISSEYIEQCLVDAPRKAVVVIDYMQLLDHRRETPPLNEQLHQLKRVASDREVSIVLISQINREFELSGRGFPGLMDVRLPNEADLELFNKTCFVHKDKVRFRAAA